MANIDKLIDLLVQFLNEEKKESVHNEENDTKERDKKTDIETENEDKNIDIEKRDTDESEDNIMY